MGGRMSKDVLKLALSKIKSARDCHPNAMQELIFEAEELLEQALAAPVQPVATVQCVNGITIGYLEVMQVVGTKLYTTPPAQEFVCSTGLCHYKPAAQPAQKRHVSYVCPQCHWSLEKQPAPVQSLPFGVGGGLVAIKTLLSRDPCGHANTAIEMINAILAEQPTTEDSSEAQAELEATNSQVEILSDALAESRREVAALKAVQEPVQNIEHCIWAHGSQRKCNSSRNNAASSCTSCNSLTITCCC
jgi:hypothetical protein